MHYLHGLVGGVQVVVEEPADRLPLPGPRLLLRGTPCRVFADKVVKPELAIRRAGQQTMIGQGGQAPLGFGKAGSRQRGCSMQADVITRAQPEQAEQLLVARFQAVDRQLEGGQPFRAGRSGVTEGRRPRHFGHYFAGPRQVVLGQPACGELDRQWQPSARLHGGGDLGLVAKGSLPGDPLEQRYRVIGRQHV